MRYLAVLRDSLVETLDKKSLYFLLIVALVIVVFCGSVSYAPLTPERAMGYIVDSLPRVVSVQSMQVRAENFDFTPMMTGFREEKSGDFEGGYVFSVTVRPVKPFHDAVRKWELAKQRLLRGRETPIEEVGGELEEEFVRARIREKAMGRCEVKIASAPPDERVFEVKLRPHTPRAIEGGFEASFLFGAYRTRLPTSVADFLTSMQYLIVEYVAGFFGLLFAVIFTAGMIPSMLQRGTLDLLLSRPLRRPGLLLTKYAGSILYVLIPGGLLIGGCWLLMSWRAGFFNAGFLASIGCLVASFAVLQSVSVLAGVVFRSPVAAMLTTLSVWAAGAFVGFIRSLAANPMVDWTPSKVVTGMIDVLHAILPQTRDLGLAARHLIQRGNFGAAAEVATMRDLQFGIQSPDWTMMAVSSILFVAVTLGLACWIFKRRDY